MTSGNRRFLIVFLGAILVLVVLGAALALSVHRAGMLEVDVRAKGPGGCDVTGIRVPAALAHVALVFIPDHAFGHACEEMRRWVPLISEGCSQLSKCPDFTLVEVRSRDEWVRIRKRGRTLVIDVDSDCERVHISVPIGVARAFAKRIAKGRFFL